MFRDWAWAWGQLAVTDEIFHATEVWSKAWGSGGGGVMILCTDSGFSVFRAQGFGLKVRQGRLQDR